MGNLNVSIDSGIRTVTFTDLNDHVFSKFRINPTDVRLGQRMLESSDYFDHALDKKPETIEDMAALNKELEEKISYILGYDSAADIFGEVAALTVLPDGSLFVEIVISKMYEVAEPALEKRKKALQDRMNSYTSKYNT